MCLVRYLHTQLADPLLFAAETLHTRPGHEALRPRYGSAPHLCVPGGTEDSVTVAQVPVLCASCLYKPTPRLSCLDEAQPTLQSVIPLPSSTQPSPVRMTLVVPYILYSHISSPAFSALPLIDRRLVNPSRLLSAPQLRSAAGTPAGSRSLAETASNSASTLA